MQERIDRLRAEIARLRKLALSCDKKAATELHALADEMEQTASGMERETASPEKHRPGSGSHTRH
jgi:hypothetical protein